MRNYLTRYFIDAVIYHDRVILSASVNGGGRKEIYLNILASIGFMVLGGTMVLIIMALLSINEREDDNDRDNNKQ